MRVVCTHKNDSYVAGLSSTLGHVYGHDFKLWDCHNKPVFDVFDEVKPELLIIHIEYCNEQLFQALKEYSNTKVLCITNEPNQVFPGFAPHYDLADVVHYGRGKVKPYLHTDVLYYSCIPVTEELTNTLCFLSNRFAVKIFGPAQVELPQYLGDLDFRQTANAFASATINLDFHNHSRFNAIINKTLSVDHTELELDQAIRTYLNENKLYKKKVKELYEHTKNASTFHHHLADVLDLAGFTSESDKVWASLEALL